MPPLSLTHLKYAFAILPMVVKSIPGTNVKMPPSLIGEPFAFFPLPRPHTLLVAEAWPAPTAALPAAPDVLAVHATTSRPMRQLTARTLPSLLDLIPSSLPGLLLVV